MPRSSAGLRIQQDSGCSLWMLHGQGLPWVCTSFPCQRQGRTNTAPPADSHTRNTSTIKLAFKQNSVIKKNKSRTHFFFSSQSPSCPDGLDSFTAPHLLPSATAPTYSHLLPSPTGAPHQSHHSSPQSWLLFPGVPLSHRCLSSHPSQLPPVLAALPTCSQVLQVIPVISPPADSSSSAPGRRGMRSPSSVSFGDTGPLQPAHISILHNQNSLSFSDERFSSECKLSLMNFPPGSWTGRCSSQPVIFAARHPWHSRFPLLPVSCGASREAPAALRAHPRASGTFQKWKSCRLTQWEFLK